jgi:hypothetical protein
MKQTKTLQFGFSILAIVACIALTGTVPAANGQEKSESKKEAKEAPVRSNQGGRDPFRKYELPRVVVKKAGTLISTPSIQDRIEQYKAQKLAAMNARVAAPKPTTAFLLSEVQVIGISRSPRGYAAIIEASPIKLAYVIYPGERFYDGQLVAIEDNRLIFRRETVYSDGKRERSVEMKSLRQASTAEVLTATPARTAAASSNQAEAEKRFEKPAADKP